MYSEEKMGFSEIIGKRICTLCKEKDISINRLASVSNIRQSTLQNIVAGNTKNPTLKTLNKIAKGLDMTIAEFLDFTELNQLK